jgi:hypothetical protein
MEGGLGDEGHQALRAGRDLAVVTVVGLGWEMFDLGNSD